MLLQFLFKTKVVTNRKEFLGKLLVFGKGFGKTLVMMMVPNWFSKILGFPPLRVFWFPQVWIPSYKFFEVKILELQEEMVGKGVN